MLIYKDYGLKFKSKLKNNLLKIDIKIRIKNL